MIWIALFAGCIVSVLLFAWAFKKYSEDGLTVNESLKLFGIGMIILVILALAVTSFTVVGVGHACIIVDPVSGAVSEPMLGPSWFFRLPWTYPIDIFYATASTEMWTDQETGERGEYPAIHVLSKDGLDIEVDILIRYSLDPKSLVALYRSFPDLRYEDRAVSSVVREDVRDVISQFAAIEIIEEREALSSIMTTTIFESLISEPSLHQALLESTIEIDLRDVDPPIKFKEAIEAKLTAEQQKIQAEFERERTIVLADAERQQKIIYANGTAEAIRLIKEQVGEDKWTVYYSWQQLQKVAPYVKVLIIVPDADGTPLFYTIPSE